MKRLILLGLACALTTPALAQAPPQTKPPVVPKTEQNSPDNCVTATVGQGADVDTKKQTAPASNLSDKLARSNGVICPPSHIDPDMKQPPPSPGGPMPVIPPPGTPGGDQSVQPK
jgi:hypothetical protein